LLLLDDGGSRFLLNIGKPDKSIISSPKNGKRSISKFDEFWAL
jgi:hypothetical protein